ncbi:hypothetical protein [Nocardiopsis deserti]|uniref:hypothetical protein n=1 Tax=Nocardiopsis deserti TaxID=2605988 RepID=UPI00123A40E3|nr:hypothetical protein [Nocardiopsis deserti]
MEWHGDGAGLTVPERLVQPLPATEADPGSLAALRSQEPVEEDFRDIEEFDTAYGAWNERVEEILWAEDRTAGALCLCRLARATAAVGRVRS